MKDTPSAMHNLAVPSRAASATLAILFLAASHTEAQSSQVLVPGAKILGGAQASKFVVEEGEEILVEEDTRIVASDAVIIKGRIRIADGDKEGPSRDAPRLEIVCGGLVYVGGAINGGNGGSFLGERGRAGGTGTCILIEAPVIFVDGVVEGGVGGVSGPTAKGGAGGSVDVFGSYLTSRPGTSGGLVGGRGGEPSPGMDCGLSTCNPEHECGNGGDGGDGGWAIAHEPAYSVTDDALFLWTSMAKRLAVGEELLAEPRTELGSTWLLAKECDSGGDGVDGGDSSPGDGADGANGNDGSEAHPDGWPAGHGGNGRHATGGKGGKGGVGANCCPMTGGTGGPGGDGGSATGAKGGDGGKGGDGHTASQGAGGAGGNAGSGGDAKPGGGGTGGDGGPGFGSGGAPGATGTEAGAGSAGTLGQGGQPSGVDGVAGTNGGVLGADGGDWGDPGPNCPQQ